MPELMGPAAMYEGAVASEERWQRRRADARRAFIEFQQTFPTATYDDYRQFVDGIAEGSSYVRGALPSDQVLGRLADYKQQEYAGQQMQRRLQQMSTQAQIAGQLDALASRQVLGTDDDNKILDSMASALGYNPNDPGTNSIREMVSRQYPNGLGAMRERARNEVVERYLPSIEKIVTANPNITDEQAISLVPGLEGYSNGGLAGQLIKTARKNGQAAAEAARQERVQTAVEDVRKQIESTGGQYTLPAGLSSDEAKQVEASVQPLVKSTQDKLSRDNSTAARNAMNGFMSTILGDPGTAGMFARDPAFRAQVREQLEQVAAQAGVEVKKEDVDFVMNTETTKANFKVQATEKAQLDAYKSELAKAVDVEGATVGDLPDAPIFTNPEFRTQAETLRSEHEALMTRRNQKESLLTSNGAISKTINFVTEDASLLGQIIRNDISPEDLKAHLSRVLSLSKANGSPATQEELREVIAALGAKVETLKSNTVVQERETLKTAYKASQAEAKKGARTGLNGIIDAMAQPDKDGNPTLVNAQLKELVNNHLFGENSPYSPTPRAIGILQDILSDENFIERTGGNVYMMLNEITQSPDGGPSMFVSAATETSNVAFPYGDNRGSKADYLSGQISYYDETMSVTMSDMQGFLDALSTQAIDFNTFNSYINAAQARANQEALEQRDEIIAAAEQSRYWATDGAIDRTDIANAMAKIEQRRQDSLKLLVEMKEKADKIILGAGITKEDAIIGQSPRVAPRSSVSGGDGLPGGKSSLGRAPQPSLLDQPAAPAPTVRPRNRGVTQ